MYMYSWSRETHIFNIGEIEQAEQGMVDMITTCYADDDSVSCIIQVNTCQVNYEGQV
jgi:hypothetical protein